MPFKISNAQRTAQQMAMRKAKTRQQKKPRFSATPVFTPTKADDRGYAGGGRARYIGSGSRGGITPTPKGKPLIKGMIRTPAFQPTKADDRGYRKGGKLRTEYAKGGPGKFRYELDGDLDNTGRAGYFMGGATSTTKSPLTPRQPTGPLTMTPVRRKSRKKIRSGAKRSGGR